MVCIAAPLGLVGRQLQPVTTADPSALAHRGSYLLALVVGLVGAGILCWWRFFRSRSRSRAGAGPDRKPDLDRDVLVAEYLLQSPPAAVAASRRRSHRVGQPARRRRRDMTSDLDDQFFDGW